MMKEDIQVRQLFKDHPIDQQALKRMQMNIMDFVLTNSVDFRQKINLERRRRWGIAVTTALFVLSLIITALLVVFGSQLFGLMRHLIIEVAPYLPTSWIEALGQGLYGKVELFIGILTSFKLIWQNYSIAVMILLGIWVIHKGIENKGQSAE